MMLMRLSIRGNAASAQPHRMSQPVMRYVTVSMRYVSAPSLHFFVPPDLSEAALACPEAVSRE